MPPQYRIGPVRPTPPRPDGGWLFSATAEHSADSVADGPCRGSVIGQVSARGELLAMRRVAGAVKVEGLALRPDGAAICMVTDADDPERCAQMLYAGWPQDRSQRRRAGPCGACAIVAGAQTAR